MLVVPISKCCKALALECSGPVSGSYYTCHACGRLCNLATEEKSESAALKPCPFCNASARLFRQLVGDRISREPQRETWAVSCNGPACSGGLIFVSFNTEEDAVGFWNTRPIEDALRADLVKAREELEITKETLEAACEVVKAEEAKVEKLREAIRFVLPYTDDWKNSEPFDRLSSALAATEEAAK